MSKIRNAVAVFAALAVVMTASGTATSGPPGHAKKGWKQQDSDGESRRNRRGGKHRKAKHWGGPPPWAPAHGYRRKHQTYRTSDGRRVRFDESRLVALPETGVGTCNRDVLGGILGAAAGAAVGSKFGKGDGKTAATIAGAIVGALIGGNIGRAMDQVDQSCVGQVLERAETGRSVEWRNPDNGTDYRVTPTRTYQSADGRYCREYTTTIIIDGRQRRAYGQACRQPDGSWQRQG